MGVLNVTPDSFSGDGVSGPPSLALEHALRVVAEGTDVLDIGGESTRPGATPVENVVELERVMPVLEALAGRLAAPISVDTRKAAVAEIVLKGGAHIINDVSGLADGEMAAVVADSGAGLVLVHNEPSEPGVDVISTVRRGLAELVDRAVRAGVPERDIIIDPGLGFGKRWRENLEIVRRLAEIREIGLPLLVGPSRKGTIGKVLGVSPDQRLEGTAALVAACIAAGADAVRVHDVQAMARVARMTDALVRDQRSTLA